MPESINPLLNKKYVDNMNIISNNNIIIVKTVLEFLNCYII